MTPYSIRRCVLISAIIGGVILIGGWAGHAQTSNPGTNIPVAKDALQYLKETIDWYRHLRLQEQMATDPSDLTFLDDDRQIAKQIVQLSFDFARAEASRVAKQAAPVEDTDQASQSVG